MNKNTREQAGCKQADSGIAITQVVIAVFAKLVKNILRAHTNTCPNSYTSMVAWSAIGAGDIGLLADRVALAAPALK